MNSKIPAIFASGLLALTTAACQTTGDNKQAVINYTQISKLSAFQGGVVGKKLEYKSGHIVVIDEDGTWEGDWGGKKIYGDWNWDDGAFCRTINIGDRDCQIFEMSEKFDRLRVTRNRGSGNQYIYKILR